MPLPLELQGKGGSDFTSDVFPEHLWGKDASCFLGGTEPTSVLDSRRSPSTPTSSSSLGSGSTAFETGSSGVAAAAASGGGVASEKCGTGMEDWENVLSDFASSPGHDQSILRSLMGENDDPNAGFVEELDFHGGESFTGSISPNFMNDFVPSNSRGDNTRIASVPNGNPQFSSSRSNLLPIFSENFHAQPVFHVNQIQNQPPQNPAGFLQFPFFQREQEILMPPHPKRLNTGVDPFVQRQIQQQGFCNSFQFLSNPPQYKPTTVGIATNSKKKMVGCEEMDQNQKQAIMELIYRAAELVETGNAILAQGILARLNQHHLSLIGKPFQRVIFYFKESLQSLLPMAAATRSSPFSLVYKVGAFKSFSEISPLVHFGNFTCNQAILEALEGYDRVHIVDFDIGYGFQWASLMQDLASRNGNPSSLKITALVPSLHEDLQLGFTRESLDHFANELNLAFELETVGIDLLSSVGLSAQNGEAIAVNLPISALSNYRTSIPIVLRFVKQLFPKIVVSIDQGFEKTEFPFAQHVVQAVHSYTSLLESLDAVNPNADALRKIEKYIIQPGIEKLVLGRHCSPQKMLPWRSLLLSTGFSPSQFSNFAESQAECLVQRTPVRGFHVQKRQSSLVLCWHQKELISVSAWKC